MEDNGLSVLKLCNDGKIFKRTLKGSGGVKIYKKINVYDIDFHPTIWKKEVLFGALESRNLSPWEIEPLFSKYLSIKGCVCGISKSKIDYDELIVGGKFFRREFKKHCRNRYTGERKLITRFQDFDFRLKRFIRHITPRFAINVIKKLTGKKGHSDQ